MVKPIAFFDHDDNPKIYPKTCQIEARTVNPKAGSIMLPKTFTIWAAAFFAHALRVDRFIVLMFNYSENGVFVVNLR